MFVKSCSSRKNTDEEVDQASSVVSASHLVDAGSLADRSANVSVPRRIRAPYKGIPELLQSKFNLKPTQATLNDSEHNRGGHTFLIDEIALDYSNYLARYNEWHTERAGT